jgi:hypothetical protein
MNHIFHEEQFGEPWFSFPNLYSRMVEKFPSGSKFVEVGSWKGKSSAYMAVEIVNSNKKIDFYCVDTWEGSIEHAGMQELARLYDIFIDNMRPVEPYYFPLKMKSLEAVTKFEDNSLDFVFIDASHEYDDVKEDINAWLPKLKPGGILAGHDYYTNSEFFPGVYAAANELLDFFEVDENCFIYTKPDPNKLKGLPPVHFISITDTPERREVLCKKFKRWGIENETPHIFDRYVDEDHKIESDMLDRLSIGSRGPVTSHLKAIREWYENTDEEIAFFCEDDLGFDSVQYWNFNWKQFFAELPSDWGCVQLALIRRYFDHFMVGLRSRCWCDWSACAYIINRKHAGLLLENYYSSDVFTLNLVGDSVDIRVDWAKVPTVETIIFSPVTGIYSAPLFVEDINNCKSTYLHLVEDDVDISSGQADHDHISSYQYAMDWWKNTGKNLNIKQFSHIVR